MQVLSLLPLAIFTTALPIPPQWRASAPQSAPDPIFTNYATNRIPTPFESAVQARRILQKERYGVMTTIFPSSTSAETFRGALDGTEEHAYERRPSTVANTPIGLPEYFATCEGDGNPTLLAIGISTSVKNSKVNPNVSMTITSHDPYGRDWESQAAHPRFSLQGYLEPIEFNDEVPAQDDESDRKELYDLSGRIKERNVKKCFADVHPDSVAWFPGNEIHESYWARLVVREVYWIGGFGDRAYIGWISREDWEEAGEYL